MKRSLLWITLILLSLFGCSVRENENDVAKVSAALSALTFPTHLYDTTPLELNTSVDGISMTWTSTDPSLITPSGEVTLPLSGSKIVVLTATLNLNNVTREKEFFITMVSQPPLYFDLPATFLGFGNAKVYDGIITGEKQAPVNPKCFAGAWYRKAVSSKDAWLGIEGIITLPEFTPSEDRYDETNNRYLDNASIYLGGHAGAETDVGLIFERGCSDASCTSPTNERIAYRPFWRYIDSGSNTYAHENYRLPQYYYLPGDTLRISVFSPRPNTLQMEIEVIETTQIDKFVALRESWRIENNTPSDFVSPEFPSIGHGGPNAEFKRVNAIDQVANEGKPAIMTSASVENAVWHEVYLYRSIQGVLRKVPFVQDRFASMICPNPDAFVIDYNLPTSHLGGEIITISPKRVLD